ncbi:hypothetical protein ACTQX1_03430 [Collinsella bouchesdurhonensis]|uniref:hypothetical protein n=1 Tax=Collinsella bouchesdurhonensis TaxID=1907654 RepID=UPI0012B5ABB2|nr:hypothetical protein [Collinsella bouchesdurhonensis]MDY3054167.1 hypothetical protein [Collinsella bouchesdurhonensis]
MTAAAVPGVAESGKAALTVLPVLPRTAGRTVEKGRRMAKGDKINLSTFCHLLI